MSTSDEAKEAILKQVKELIAKNKTSEALKLLSKSQFSSVDKELIMLNSKYNKIKQEENLGTLSEEKINLKLNKLKLAIVDVAEKVTMKPEELAAISKSKSSKSKKSKKSSSGSAVPWTIVGIVGTLLALILIFILWPGSDEDMDGGEGTEMMDENPDYNDGTYEGDNEGDVDGEGDNMEDGGFEEGDGDGYDNDQDGMEEDNGEDSMEDGNG